MAATIHPQVTAVIDDAGSQISYEALFREADVVAAQAREAGIGPGHLVILRAEDSVRYVAGLLAVAMSGAAFLVLDQRIPAKRADRIIEETKPVLVISGTSMRRDLVRYARTAHAARLPDPRPEFEHAAYVIYTSGSTGVPKGVILPRTGLGNVIEQQRRCFGVQPGERVLQWASWSFDAAIFDLTMAIGAGATLVLRNRARKLPGESLTSTLEQDEISVLTITPTALVTTNVPVNCPRLRVIICAGEMIPAAVVRLWAGDSRKLFNAYGPAEATIWSTLKAVSAVEDVQSAGRPIKNVTVSVRDSLGRPVSGEGSGEVWLGGLGVALGYVRGTVAEQACFVLDDDPDQGGDNGRHEACRLYRTGDKGRINASGELELGGRLDRQVKVHGVRIELGEIEATLLRNPEVTASAAILAGEAADARIIGFVVPNSAGTLDPRALRTWLLTELPANYVPGELRVIDALPLNAAGKIDYDALGRLAAASTAPDTHGTGTEGDSGEGQSTGPAAVTERLTAIWKQVLSISDISLDDDLFDLGGNSLRATRLAARVKAEFGIELGIRKLYEARTIRNVSVLLGEHEG
jgi:amino acid adenylation domain-containing protein